MLQWQVNDQSILFSFSDKDQRVPLRDIETQATGETFAQWIVLSEWLENGQAQETDNAIEVPCDEVVRLTECDRQVLQLPLLYPFEIVIRSKGAIHEPEFQFHWGFFEYEQGRQLSTSRTGCLLHLQDGSAYLLSEKQYALCQALDEFERQSAALRHPRGNWLRFAEIKARAEAAAAVLEPYLRGENVVVPHIIHLRVDRGEGDTIEIRPEIEGIDNPQFQRKFDRFPTPRDVYNLEDEAGNRTRVIPTEQQVQELKKIKSKRRIAGQEKRELLSHPQAVFDPEMVDLDQFSRRVMEIGIYHPRSYPFITPYKSQWIPGFCQEGKKVLIRSQEELAEFKTTVEKAVQNNQDHVTWKEATLALEDIQNIIQTAERQLACPERPAARDGESPETEHHCLIIYENVESLDYIEKSQGDISGGYRFFPVPHFREEVSILPHQQEGIAWLQTLYGKVPGVLLADDMGLGKTFQALSFLSWVHSEHNPENHPSLIVAPIALLENWVEEINKFFHPFAAVEMIQSEYFRIFNTQRKKYEGQLPFQKDAIYLTNYQILRNHAAYFGREDWSVVILDEAQNIKTPGALVTNAAKALKSRFRVAVTGTPVENTLVDMWCIMDFASPGLLGSAKEFAREYQNPLREEGTDFQELGIRLRGRIGVCIKRHTKEDILKDLPLKHELPRPVAMPDAQQQRYVAELNRARESNAGDQDGRTMVLSVLHALRDISDHPYIPDRRIDSYSAGELISTSAKLSALMAILDEVQSLDEKVLLFAERKETQKMLVKILKERFGIRSPIINGDTPAGAQAKKCQQTRQEIIHQFQQKSGFHALVLSPLAAGVGFNITGANHVVHYSRHWNPAREQQATDRVYRIGQAKDVYVYYPMAIADDFDSFDVTLDRLLRQKKQLASSSLFPTERMEVQPADLFDSLQKTDTPPARERYLILHDLDRLNPYRFEAAVAALWQKQDVHRVILTPRTNDKGADVIVLASPENLLLQVKQSGQPLGDTAVGEILKAHGYYRNIYQTDFILAVVTNHSLVSNAQQMANQNHVRVYDRNSLSQWLEQFPITNADVWKMESQRKRD